MDRATIVARLRAAGCVFAEDEAALLLGESAPGCLAANVAAREAGTPLEQLLGFVEFDGLRLAVGPGVFVPRQRTRLLARRAAELTPPDGVVVDLCCGVGPVAARVLAEKPDATVVAVDLDPAAADYARLNLPRATVLVGDLFEPVPLDLLGRVDVVAANAPYVPDDELQFMPRDAREHEPIHTLSGGADGLRFHRRIAAEVVGWLRPGGSVLVETSRRQAAETAGLLVAAGLAARIEREADLDGLIVFGLNA